MNKAELQDGSGHDRSQGFHRAAGAEYALYAAWMQKRWYQKAAACAPQSTTPPPRGRGGRTANRSPGRLRPHSSRLPLNPGRPSLQGSILFLAAPLPTSAIAQVSTIFYSLLESHLASSKPASALDAVLRDGNPAPQPSEGSLDSPQPGKSTFGHENGSTECQQAPRQATY